MHEISRYSDNSRQRYDKIINSRSIQNIVQQQTSASSLLAEVCFERFLLKCRLRRLVVVEQNLLRFAFGIEDFAADGRETDYPVIPEGL